MATFQRPTSFSLAHESSLSLEYLTLPRLTSNSVFYRLLTDLWESASVSAPHHPFSLSPAQGRKKSTSFHSEPLKGFPFSSEKKAVDAAAPKPNITCVPSHPDCSLILLPVTYLCSHTVVGLTSLLISLCSPGWCGFYYVDQAGFEPSASASQGLGMLPLCSWFACKPLEQQRYYVSTYWYSAWQRTSVLRAAL